MSDLEEIKALIAACSPEQQTELFTHLRERMGLGDLHPFEVAMNARGEVILEALSRAGALNIRSVRGCLSEATFFTEIVAHLDNWQNVTPPGDLPYDAALRDETGTVTVQVKLQRRATAGGVMLPVIKNGHALAELQRTRNGTDGAGAATRPYRFGEFDLLAVCMEPSHGTWSSFMYAPERWLLPRPERALIQIMQPVSLVRDAIWTNDFREAVVRLRSELPRPAAGVLI